MIRLVIDGRKAPVVFIATSATNVGAYPGMFVGRWLSQRVRSADAGSIETLEKELAATFCGGLVGVAVSPLSRCSYLFD
jgi:hypothetical protein